MRPFLFYLLVVSTVQFLEAAKVSGKILNYDGETKIALLHSEYGMQPDRIMPTFDLANPDGSFSYDIEINGPEISRLIIDGLIYELLLYPGSQLYIELSLEETDGTKESAESVEKLRRKISSLRKLEGSLSTVNCFLNSQEELVLRTSEMHSSVLSRELAFQHDILSFDSIFSSLLDNKMGEIDDFLSTIENGEKKEVEAILKDRFEAFYLGLFLDAISLRRITAAQRSVDPDLPDRSIYNEDWMEYSLKKLSHLTSSIQVRPSSQFYMKLLSQIHYFLRDYDPFDSEEQETNLDKIVYKYLVEFNLQDDLSQFFKIDQTVENAFLIYNLHTFLSNQMFYSPVLLSCTEQILSENPHISEFGTIQQNFDKLKEYIQLQNKDGDAKIITRKYDSFQNVVDQFEGENLFVDIWATWCKPCVYQFSHMDWLYEKQEAGVLKIVFLSVDEESQRKKWKEMIRYNNLQGTHILLTDSAKDELWSILDGMNGAIPRYLLIDETGQIVNSSASSPEKKVKLEKELEQLYKNPNKGR